MQLPGCKQEQQEQQQEQGKEDAGLAAWLAFYFILFALITSPATLLKNIFACWEISRSLFPAPGPLPPLTSPCRACKDMACHAAGPAVVPAVVAVVVVLASAYVSLGLLM